MKLTVHLAREDVADFSELIRPVYIESLGLEKLDPTDSLGFPAQAYIQQDKPTQPKWLGFLKPHFDVSNIWNTSTSFVLLAKVSERIFALTFGMSGYSALDPARLEKGFGLRVSANSVDEDDLITVDTRNLDAVTRQQRTHLSTGSRISDFSIPLEQDWVRRIQGKTDKLSYVSSLAGADSLQVNLSAPLKRLPEVLTELLERYEATDYKRGFPFLDYFQPLSAGSEVVSTLDEMLLEWVKERREGKISLAMPQIIDDEQVNHFEISARRKVVELDEVTLSGAYRFLDECYEGEDPLGDTKIVPIADSGQASGKKRTLRDWVVCELEHSGKTYVLSLGDWYEVNRDYVTSVNDAIRKIPDMTDEFNFEEWDPKEKEGDYNDRVAKKRKWVLLDKDNYYIGGPSQKIEICDLLSKDMHLICVKQQSSSATLSHLFSQGSVSAELYRGEQAYKDRIYRDASEYWQEVIEEPADGPVIVYAIANDRAGSLADTLFFFSKISLLFNARIVQRLGLGVALARIPMPEGSLRRKKRKPRKRPASQPS
ncbi:DUF6119 family protein [Streptomyces sp. DSM 3412]|uniref:DUF6119 family protein n=1 Tax=Streptomyces gottesmaniae TaxID=3075518 RepID=A0ABU2Z1T6_9ACTN|nr:DUF6119 family protein [Streptomyces sp. DSM 3412]MDT0570549.1 DUF6119 family protein [Streptomyces sp. DSM 3412]